MILDIKLDPNELKTLFYGGFVKLMLNDGYTVTVTRDVPGRKTKDNLEDGKMKDEMKSMTFDEYQRLAGRTIDPKLERPERLNHAMFGMVSELGEFFGIYQKFYQGHVEGPEHIKKELGDLLWFIAEYCTARDWTLEEIAKMNIDKLRARYPDGFDAEHSLHRAEGDI